MKHKLYFFILLTFLFSSCSFERYVYRKTADVLSASGNSTVFTGEPDPVLIGDSLPMMLKIYELVLDKQQDNDELQIATGSLFIMYANGFVQGPAELLNEDDFELYQDELKRAKLHYLRGSKHIITGIGIRHPGFSKAMDENDFNAVFESFGTDECGALYWYAASLLGAVSTDPLDSALSLKIPRAFSAILRILELNEDYLEGTVHELLVSLYSSIPEYILYPADSAAAELIRQKAEDYYSEYSLENADVNAKIDFHFNKAVELANGMHAGVYISYASGVAVKRNNPELYKNLLEKALSIDIDAKPEVRLVNTLAQKKARKLLLDIGNIFLLN